MGKINGNDGFNRIYNGINCEVLINENKKDQNGGLMKQTALVTMLLVTAQLVMAAPTGKEVVKSEKAKEAISSQGGTATNVLAVAQKTQLMKDISTVLRVENPFLSEMFDKRPILAELAADAIALKKKGNLTPDEEQFVYGVTEIFTVLGKNNQVTKLSAEEKSDIRVALKVLDIAAKSNEYSENGKIPAKLVQLVALTGKNVKSGDLLPAAVKNALVATYNLKKSGKLDNAAWEVLKRDMDLCVL